MRSRPTPEDQNLSNPTVAYAPSVPVSVYKELAIQLQASQALSEALNAQNQQLLRQNNQLQQELDKAIESVLYWRQINKVPNRPFSQTQTVNRNSPSSPAGSLPFLAKQAKAAFPEITELEQGRYRRYPPERVADISGWSLAIALVLIMVTAFGAGYLMMRPLIVRR
jgi:serine phosphatase RsbU (regulator of sigma subunit)